MDSLAVIHGQNIFETALRFSIKRMIQSMQRLPLIHGQKIVETTVKFSIKRMI